MMNNAFEPVRLIPFKFFFLSLAVWMTVANLPAQERVPTDSAAYATAAENAALQHRVEKLELEVAELKQLLLKNQAPQQVLLAANGIAPGIAGLPTVALPQPVISTQDTSTSPTATAVPAATAFTAEDRKTLDFLHDATINVGLDTYYEYNFNEPIGRVNLLRAYDVLSNNFNLNQASVIFEDAPNLSEGRRFGGRLDLQYGQATESLQGNPNNEPRPEIYRNIFQAYGTYVAPLGKGLNIDFGKFGSSIGIEGNYTKDQLNYSRSYWFNYLPFYHMGLRLNYPVNDRFTLTYWVVNGTNQVEATNGFKDELFGFTAKPVKSVTWVVNYYFGQEHPDRVVVPPTSPIPVQPGLSFEPIIPAPNGHLNIFDTYGTWQINPKLSASLEGDYVIERLWQKQAPGRSDAPSHVIGGAAYLHYQLWRGWGVAGRAEYLSDRGGLFSGLNQALKETTATLDYQIGNGFLMRYEWRRDWSNQPSFLTSTQGVLSKYQDTAAVGVIWWWGRKEGAW